MSNNQVRGFLIHPKLRDQLLSDGVLCEMYDDESKTMLLRLRPSVRRLVYGLSKPFRLSVQDFENLNNEG